MGVCKACKQSVNRTAKDKIICGQCQSLYHGKCVNIKESDMEILSGQPWSCAPCVSKLRLQRSSSDTTPIRVGSAASSGLSPEVTLDLLHESLAELKIDINNSQQEVRDSLKSCIDKLDNNSSLLDRQNEIIKAQEEIICKLQLENEGLRRNVQDMQLQMDVMEQYSRRNTVEIYGVPSTDNEDVMKIALDVCSAVGMTVREEAIDSCHRLRMRNNRVTAGIAVKFVRRRDADEVLRRRRMKRDLATNHIGVPGVGQPVYVNQSLTVRRRVLFAKAKQLQKRNGWKYVWLDRSGNVKVRCCDSTKVVSIKNEGDLESLNEVGPVK
jgi:hypothetical protein